MYLKDTSVSLKNKVLTYSRFCDIIIAEREREGACSSIKDVKENIQKMAKLYDFFKNAAGKITAVGATAIAGVAGNFKFAGDVKDELTLKAIKDGVVQGGGSFDGMTDAQIQLGWEYVQAEIANGSGSSVTQSIYDAVMSNLDKVDIQSHYQPSTLVGTAVCVAIPAIIFTGLYLYGKHQAKKEAEMVTIEDIK